MDKPLEHRHAHTWSSKHWITVSSDFKREPKSMSLDDQINHKRLGRVIIDWKCKAKGSDPQARQARLGSREATLVLLRRSDFGCLFWLPRLIPVEFMLRLWVQIQMSSLILLGVRRARWSTKLCASSTLAGFPIALLMTKMIISLSTAYQKPLQQVNLRCISILCRLSLLSVKGCKAGFAVSLQSVWPAGVQIKMLAGLQCLTSWTYFGCSRRSLLLFYFHSPCLILQSSQLWTWRLCGLTAWEFSEV